MRVGPIDTTVTTATQTHATTLTSTPSANRPLSTLAVAKPVLASLITSPTSRSMSDAERTMRNRIGVFGFRQSFLPKIDVDQMADKKRALHVSTEQYRETVLSLFDAEGVLDVPALLMASVSEDEKYFKSHTMVDEYWTIADGHNVNTGINDLQRLCLDGLRAFNPAKKIACVSILSLGVGLFTSSPHYAALAEFLLVGALALTHMVLDRKHYLELTETHKNFIQALQPEQPIQYYLNHPQFFSQNVTGAVGKLIACAEQFIAQTEFMHDALKGIAGAEVVEARSRYECMIAEAKDRITVLEHILTQLPDMQRRISALAALHAATAMDDLKEQRPALNIESIQSQLSESLNQTENVLRTASEMGIAMEDIDQR